MVLEGGGDRGAYQAGAIDGLVSQLPKEDTSYDIVTGISAGSLNGGLLALYETGDEANASKELK